MGMGLKAYGLANANKNAPIKFYLRELRLDAHGYYRGTAYFGRQRGTRVYEVESEDNQVYFTERARDRDHAKELVRKRFPYARFFR